MQGLLISFFTVAAAAVCHTANAGLCDDDLLESNDSGGLQLLQTNGLAKRRANTAAAGMKTASELGKRSQSNDCHASMEADRKIWDKAKVDRHNATLIQQYLDEHKISQEGGVPIINMVHIPKTGGDAIKMVGLALGEYAFADYNNHRGNKEMPFDIQLSQQIHGGALEHVPAADLDQHVAKYLYEGSEVFCVMREPFARLVSAACHYREYSSGYPLIGAIFDLPLDQLIQRELSLYAGGLRYWDTSFYIPQVDYLKGEYGCKHIIDFDHLEDDFNVLMRKFGMEELIGRFPGANETHSCHHTCDFSSENMSTQTHELYEKIFADDIKFWRQFKTDRGLAAELA